MAAQINRGAWTPTPAMDASQLGEFQPSKASRVGSRAHRLSPLVSEALPWSRHAVGDFLKGLRRHCAR
jgi:hypothetical protein